MKISRSFWSVALILSVVCFAGTAQAGLLVFGTGLSLPESISLVPAGFGSYGGNYFIPDPGINNVGLGNIDYLPPTGGTATIFVTIPGQIVRPLGGMFLPSNFGSFGGQFLAVGGSANGSFAVAIASDGTVTPVTSTPTSQFVSPVLAPAGFGSVAGQVLVTNNDGTVRAIDQSGNLTTFATVPGALLFGAALAPQAFGAFGGDLLVSDGASGNIFAIDPQGNASLFANVPRGLNQPGLRQMTFAPNGFGTYGGDLVLSISGSGAGGGTFGAVVVLDENGNEVAQLIVGTQVDAFDPRGLLFADNQTLLISSSDPIYLATLDDFRPIPEPTTLLMFGGGMIGLWLKRRL
jgi:PEP-CTERM motif